MLTDSRSITRLSEDLVVRVRRERGAAAAYDRLVSESSALARLQPEARRCEGLDLRREGALLHGDRGAHRPAAEFAQFDLIEAQLADQGITITQAEGQYYFPQYDPGSMTPVWCVLGSDVENLPWEFFFDPLTGQRWETRRVVFELGEVTGAVMGYYPDPEDIYATAERFTVAGGRFVQYPMMGVRVNEAGSSGGQSTTNRDGQYRVRVAADPGQTAFIECALEYGFAPMR